MPDDLPLAAVFALLAAIGALRGAATYAVGRAARQAGEGRERAEELFARPGMVRAHEVVRRWGAPAVVASYLLPGLQTAVCAAAGLLRMSPWYAVPAVVVGSLLRAALYVTVGVAVLTTWASGPTGRWALLAVVVAVVTLVLVGRRR